MTRWEESWRRRGMKDGERKIARMRVNRKRRRDLEEKDFEVVVVALDMQGKNKVQDL
jgi:hypothetical protein